MLFKKQHENKTGDTKIHVKTNEDIEDNHDFLPQIITINYANNFIASI